MSQDINTGAFSEALNLKADIDLRNIDTDKCDIVIEYQAPTSTNNYTWYRLYASGWVEQGGIINSNTTSILLLVRMEDNSYNTIISYYKTNSGESPMAGHLSTNEQTTNSFTTKSSGYNRVWQVSGLADMTGHEILPRPSTNIVLEMVKAIYPVGSLYIGTQSTCPMAVIIPDSTWGLVSSGRALWTGNGSNANTTINAGLPDITGSFTPWGYKNQLTPSGAFTQSETTAHAYASTDASAGSKISFKASNSNAIYGKSTTVQPPAYVVNVWRRTA